jgi:hypothetical protein
LLSKYIGVDSEPLAERFLEVGLKTTDPPYLLGVSLVVEVRVTDEYVMLATGNVDHGLQRLPWTPVRPNLIENHKTK